LLLAFTITLAANDNAAKKKQRTKSNFHKRFFLSGLIGDFLVTDKQCMQRTYFL
jgi:hypothetical protein